MTRRAYDDFDFDTRQRSAEEVHEDVMHAATTFGCQACGEEYDIADRVVLTAHPMMPAFCLDCACSEFPGRRT